MSGPFCFNFHEQLLPYLRAESAKRLSERGVRQNRIAEHLGVSQAMVSKYLRSNPRPPTGASVATLQTLVDRSVTTVLEEEQKGRLPAWCPICPSVWPAMNLGFDECLRGEGPRSPDDSQRVLENLHGAAQRLRSRDFLRLAPEVNINIAMATPEARDSRSVAAFPGRIVEVHGELRPVSEPEFGASQHLSDVLLKVRRFLPEVRAVACFRDHEETRRALKAAGLTVRFLKRVRADLVVALPKRQPVDALIDPGAFGIEPITYFLGESAIEAVEKAERVLKQLAPSTKK